MKFCLSVRVVEMAVSESFLCFLAESQINSLEYRVLQSFINAYSLSDRLNNL